MLNEDRKLIHLDARYSYNLFNTHGAHVPIHASNRFAYSSGSIPISVLLSYA
jgi:hypothetical protein